MNLIEQLGGYERAKYLKENALMVGSKREKLISALLEHRRENNIFDVGDLVVSTLEGQEFWMNCICKIEAFHKKMAITSCGGHSIHHYEFRHATPEEIKVGHRL